jgi:hypothetical protein
MTLGDLEAMMCSEIGGLRSPVLGGKLRGNMPSCATVNHEAPLSGYFILLLREELEHIWEFVQFEEEQV